MGTGKPPGRPSKKLENYKDWITERHNSKATIDEILIDLQMTHNLQVGRSTLLKQMIAWDLRHRRAQWKDSPALRMRVKHCFDTLQLSDADAQLELQKHGYDMHPSRIAKLRKEMGMYKRTNEEQRPTAESNCEEIMRKEYEKEEMRDMSLKKLHKYLKGKYNINGREMVYQVARRIDPEGEKRRLRLQMQNTRRKQLEKQNEERGHEAGQGGQIQLGQHGQVQGQYAAPDVLDPALAANGGVTNFDPGLAYNQSYVYPGPYA